MKWTHFACVCFPMCGPRKPAYPQLELCDWRGHYTGQYRSSVISGLNLWLDLNSLSLWNVTGPTCINQLDILILHILHNTCLKIMLPPVTQVKWKIPHLEQSLTWSYLLPALSGDRRQLCITHFYYIFC